MRNVILVISILFLHNSFGQEKRFHFGASIFPNISNGLDVSKGLNSEYYTGIQTLVFSYSLGAEIDIKLEKGWRINIGLRFLKIGDKSKPFPPDPSRGYFFERNYSHKHFYLEVPIEANKNFGENWFLSAGLSPIFKLWDRGLITTGGSTLKIDAQTYSTGKMAAAANLGFGYQLNFEDSYIKMLPYFQFHLIKPVTEIPSLDVLPPRSYFSLGLKFSYMF